jgi:ATP-dependent DNA helicase RecG
LAPPDGLTLRELRDKPVTVLHAVGPRLSEQLGELGIATVLDLLEHYPRRYHDRTDLVEIASLTAGQEATVAGDVKKVSVRRPRGRRPIVELELFD